MRHCASKEMIGTRGLGEEDGELTDPAKRTGENVRFSVNVR